MSPRYYRPSAVDAKDEPVVMLGDGPAPTTRDVTSDRRSSNSGTSPPFMAAAPRSESPSSPVVPGQHPFPAVSTVCHYPVASAAGDPGPALEPGDPHPRSEGETHLADGGNRGRPRGHLDIRLDRNIYSKISHRRDVNDFDNVSRRRRTGCADDLVALGSNMSEHGERPPYESVLDSNRNFTEFTPQEWDYMRRGLAERDRRSAARDAQVSTGLDNHKVHRRHRDSKMSSKISSEKLELKELKEKKKALDIEIEQLRARLKPKSKANQRMDREPSVAMSHEVKEMIDQVAGGRKTKKSRRSRRKDADERLSLEPVTQIHPESSLGRAFRKLEDNSSVNLSDSDSDSSSSDGGDSNSTDLLLSDTPSCRRKRSKRRSRRTRKSSIKPTPPEKYDGSANHSLFLHFMVHATSYIKYGNVERKRCVHVLSEFLTGRAWTFYARDVSLNPEDWTVEKFFIALFNYCFPVDYRAQQRYKLSSFKQDKLRVGDYVAELSDLFATIGIKDKREQVSKLWLGFRPSIQSALWRDKLNPETSRWKDIIFAAEHHEMAQSVADRHHGWESQSNDSDDSDCYKDAEVEGSDNDAAFEPEMVVDYTGSCSAQMGTSRGTEERLNDHGSLPKAAGKCFCCSVAGHYSNECSLNIRGLDSHRMGFVDENEEETYISDEDKSVYDLHVGAMALEMVEDAPDVFAPAPENFLSVPGPGRMFGGCPTQIVVDSGSGIDLLSLVFAHRLGLLVTNVEPAQCSALVEHRLSPLVIGTTQAGCRYRGSYEERAFSIVSTMMYNVVLGIPWIRDNFAVLSFGPGIGLEGGSILNLSQSFVLENPNGRKEGGSTQQLLDVQNDEQELVDGVSIDDQSPNENPPNSDKSRGLHSQIYFHSFTTSTYFSIPYARESDSTNAHSRSIPPNNLILDTRDAVTSSFENSTRRVESTFHTMNAHETDAYTRISRQHTTSTALDTGDRVLTSPRTPNSAPMQLVSTTYSRDPVSVNSYSNIPVAIACHCERALDQSAASDVAAHSAILSDEDVIMPDHNSDPYPDLIPSSSFPDV